MKMSVREQPAKHFTTRPRSPSRSASVGPRDPCTGRSSPILFGREQQGDVHRDASKGRFLDGRQAFRRAGDFDEQIWLVRLGVQHLGLRHCRLRVVGKQRRHFQGHEPVYRTSARIDRGEQIRRADEVLSRIQAMPTPKIARLNRVADPIDELDEVCGGWFLYR